jgi:hypothetical protein
MANGLAASAAGRPELSCGFGLPSQVIVSASQIADPPSKTGLSLQYLGLLYRYAIEHATVIYTPNAAQLVRQHRLDGASLMIAEFVAHIRGSGLGA